MLDDLICKCYDSLKNRETIDAKLGDFLKMVEMRMKLAPSESEQAEFWKMLDKVRTEALAKKETGPVAAPKAKKPKSPRKKT